MKKLYSIISIFLVVVVIIGGMYYYVNRKSKQSPTANQNINTYKPVINPADFSNKITNPFFTLPVGREFTYEGLTKNGLERIVIQIEPETKNIMGIETLVYRDRVYIDNELVEDTRDYLAQDQQGSVWYFGEEVNNYENGVLIDHSGSFIAGVNGAQPGIWIKGTHTVGDSYRQEYAPGEAEDMRDVVAVNQTVTTKKGTYEGCVKMYDWTPLDPESREHKYYCPDEGALVLSEHIVREEKLELVAVNK